MTDWLIYIVLYCFSSTFLLCNFSQYPVSNMFMIMCKREKLVDEK